MSFIRVLMDRSTVYITVFARLASGAEALKGRLSVDIGNFTAYCAAGIELLIAHERKLLFKKRLEFKWKHEARGH